MTSQKSSQELRKTIQKLRELAYSSHILSFGRWARVAFIDIWASKLRFVLTILGILIGTSSVILLINIGESAKASINKTISGIGSNVVYVMHGKQSSSGLMVDPSMLIGGFKIQEANKIKHVISKKDYVQNVAFRGMQTADVSTKFYKDNTTLWIVDAAYFRTVNFDLISGKFITDNAIKNKSKVVVVGVNLAKQLYPRATTVVGKTIHIKGKTFKIIGVAKFYSSMSGKLDDVIFMPYTASKDLFTTTDIQVIFVKLTNVNKTTILERSIQPLTHENFYIMTQDDVLDQTNTVMGILTMFISVIAGISLLVGGIGVMNILLVSVKEKVKEIGLRKAVGAKNRDILQLFLIQSFIYTLIGSTLGIALGLAGELAIVSLAKLPFVISTKAIILATSMSFVVGIIFGIYPAFVASKLSPVQALREE